jgi:PAS domain S-box-containing protein
MTTQTYAPGLAVLIVDDDDAAGELERRALVRAGMNAEVVTRVDDAMRRLRGAPCGCVILDYHLPDGSPWDVVDFARGAAPRVPVVVVTAAGDESIASDCIHRGVDDYIQKREAFWDRLPPIVRRLRAASEAEQSLAHLAAIVSSSEDGIISAGLDATILSWNQGAERIYGYTAIEMVGRKATFVVPDDRRAERDAIQAVLDRGRSIRSVETTRRRKDGSTVDVSMSFSPLLDAAGRVFGITSVVRDVSEQKRSAELLAKARAQLVEAQEIAHVGSWEWDVVHGSVSWSDELYRIYGLEPRSVPASFDGFLERVHPADRAAVRDAIERCLKEKGEFSVEHRLVRSDGTLRVLQSSGRVATDRGVVLRMTGTAQELTDIKSLQARLLLADRMASVGTLAAGIAHEINNPLSYVAVNLEMVADGLREVVGATTDPRVAELEQMLDDARQGAERVRKVVRGLKSFARGGDGERTPVDVRALLDDSLKMVRSDLQARARIVRSYADVPAVMADEARLGQVFVNLLVNATHAIGEGAPDANEVEVSLRTAADHRVHVTVRDTGAGIPLELRSRIFDPFFTTKPVGEGTGLGLSICHAIVTGLGGEIAVDSELGSGSSFHVWLPATDVPVAPRGARPSGASLAAVAPTRVLVVDDDAMVAAALRRVLRGCDVTVAATGREALTLLGSDASFDVILCDLMMPDVTGMALHAELAHTRPEVAQRMIFLTGGAFSDSARAFLEAVPNPHVEKPYDPDTLRALVGRFGR